MEIIISTEFDIKWLNISGRIDSITANEIDRKFKELILNGERKIVVDCKDVNYISSAGIRTFIAAQKQLSKAGGEVILYNLIPQVFEIFKVSGLHKAFKIFANKDEIVKLLQSKETSTDDNIKTINNIQFNCLTKSSEKGKVFSIGNQTKISGSDYSSEDVISIKASEIQYGTGLCAIGDNYEEYKNYFGESLIINNSLFYYPAVKKPSVDFIINTDIDSKIEYKFFHGFGFKGELNSILSFSSESGNIELRQLIQSVSTLTTSSVFGIVLLAESKGVFGMGLKKVPLNENKPSNGKPIFESENFTEWVNFPIDPDDINNVALGAGIVFKERNQLPKNIQELISEEQSFHIHAIILEKEPLNKSIQNFESEIKRVMNDLEVKKVQHLLGQSRLGSGLIGIIELEA